MQILKLTPSPYANNVVKDTAYAGKYSFINNNDSFEKTAPSFKGGIETEIIEKISKHADLKKILSNPAKKATFFGLLASALATITEMVYDKGDYEKTDVLSAEKDVKKQNLPVKEPNVQQAVIPIDNAAEMVSKEELSGLMAEKAAKELEILKQIEFIKANKEDAYSNYLKYEQKQDEEQDEDFANGISKKLLSFQETIMAEKPEEKQVKVFVKSLFKNANKSSKNLQKQNEFNFDLLKLEKDLDDTILYIQDMYVDKVCKKVVHETGRNVAKVDVKNALELCLQEKEEPQVQLKELPKVSGKHTLAESKLIKHIESYSDDIEMHNKFVDVYSKYCGFNRKGNTIVDGQQRQNAEISNQLCDELAAVGDKKSLAKILDKYLADEVINTKAEDEPIVREVIEEVKVKDVKKKTKIASNKKNNIPSLLENKQFYDVSLAKECTIPERLRAIIEVFKKRHNQTSLIYNSGHLCRCNKGSKQRSLYKKEICAEINSRKKHPYQNLHKIPEDQVVELLSCGLFSTKIYTIHSALRFLDRFVLNDISYKDFEYMKSITEGKLKAFEAAIQDSTSDDFKIYYDYNIDNDFYYIHVPVIPDNLSGQVKLDYTKNFGNNSIILTIDKVGCIHTLFKG